MAQSSANDLTRGVRAGLCGQIHQGVGDLLGRRGLAKNIGDEFGIVFGGVGPSREGCVGHAWVQSIDRHVVLAHVQGKAFDKGNHATLGGRVLSIIGRAINASV